jgi:hypothetical protein
VIQKWDKELSEMNRNKEGRKFLFPESFMKIVGCARIYFGLPYRQTEGLLSKKGICNIAADKLPILEG